MQESDDQNVVSDLAVSQEPLLTAIELRVLGALMEKQLTTPDQYPLTVNSILTACNQKSSRDPVSNYDLGDLSRALQILTDKRYVRKEFGSRAEKYSQQLTTQLELSKKQQAVLCVMMLRGPQTLSELNTRTQRMQQFSDKDELTHCVERLCERELPYVLRLGHLPGQRGDRFGHLFSGTPELAVSQRVSHSTSESSQSSSADQESLLLLKSEIAELKETIKSLETENMSLRRQLGG